MDSLTHLALGACIGAAVAPPAWRRRAALLGAVLNSIPDLDLVPLAFVDDPVTQLSWHRGPTHSLLVLLPLGLLFGALLPRFWAPARDAPRRWLALCVLALVAHPLLDACTVYGTQLFWPLDRPPVMIASLFIVDPVFSLPLLAGACVALFARDAARIAWWGRMGIAFSAVYLSWTVLAKSNLEQALRADFEQRGMSDAKLLVAPAPLQSLVWRILAVRGDGTYYEGYYSYLANAPLKMDPYPSTIALLNSIADRPAVKRLKWFTRGYYSVRVEEGRVVFTDLRMGGEPQYLFRYVVGTVEAGAVVARDPAELLPLPRMLTREQLALAWRRLLDPQARPEGAAALAVGH